MLQTLFSRWFGGTPKLVSAAGVAHAAASVPLRAAVRPLVASGAPAVGARRALVDARGEVVGYEFSVGPALMQRLAQRADSSAEKAHFQALLAGMRLCAQQGLLAYAELPATWLAGVDAGAASGLQLGLQLNPPHTPIPTAMAPDVQALSEALAAWRAAGAQLGWMASAAWTSTGLQPDFDIGCGVDEPTEARAATRPWVAPDLPDIDSLDATLMAGALWAGCATKVAAEPRHAKALPAQTQRLMQLLNRLVRDDDTAQVVDEIKRDAALCARLLQHLNSAGVSRGSALDSIEQAVSVLGRNALYQWVAAVLLRQCPVRPAAGCLQALALARARLLELLARAAGEPSPGSLYVVGLSSVLPQLMQASLTDVLQSLGLPAEAERALRQREGPWGSYLNLVEALEEPDLVAARLLSEPLGGLDATLAMSAQAWLGR